MMTECQDSCCLPLAGNNLKTAKSVPPHFCHSRAFQTIKIGLRAEDFSVSLGPSHAYFCVEVFLHLLEKFRISPAESIRNN
jgi:hypothetical protein